MNRLFYIMMAAGLLAACSDGATLADAVDNQPVQDAGDRPVRVLEISVPLPGADTKAAETRIAYTPTEGATPAFSDDGLLPSWESYEELGVFIKNGEVLTPAGTMTSNGPVSSGKKTFRGSVTALQDDESYVFMSPNVSSINYAIQSGNIGNAVGVSNLLPIVWTSADGETISDPTVDGYVVHLLMQFKEDPGEITQVRLMTMPMGAQPSDNVWAASYTPQKAGNAVSEIVMNTRGRAVWNETSELWEAETYLVTSHVEQNVFNTKYHVKVTAGGVPLSMSQYRSFAGQQIAGDKNLPMLADGKVYNLTAQFSPDYCTTEINGTYKVNILTGMWNEFGKPYDPNGLIVYQGDGRGEMPAAGVLPTQLVENKAAILSRYANAGTGASNTPTIFGTAAGSIYTVTATAISDVKQEDVTINNITITQPTEVFLTFISEYGWNENLLGYYHYSGAAPASGSEVLKTLVFPNFSKPNHEPFNKKPEGTGNDANNIGQPSDAPCWPFETVKLLYTDDKGFVSTTFPAGTTIGFMMMIDTEANENAPKSGYDLLNWNQWKLFTNTVWNKANTNFKTTYSRNNFYSSADICKSPDGTEKTPVPGLAIYGVKDRADNDANTAYGAMIFMVSTSDPAAMQTQNRAYFNIGTGNHVMEKPAAPPSPEPEP